MCYSAQVVDAWLNPDPKDLAASYAILDDRQRPYYGHRRLGRCRDMVQMHVSVGESVLGTASMTARVIATFALQHMKAATTFRDHVAALESANLAQPFGAFFEDIRSYGSACIMSSVASLEALINEFFITPDGPLRKRFADFEDEFWRPRVGVEVRHPLEKYQVALEMLGYPRFDEQGSPFKDAWALVELRNALVHYKPTWDPDRPRKVTMVEVLTGKYELSPFPDSGSDFVTMRSMSASGMRWVVATTLRFMREFHGRARLDDKKMAAFWRLDT